MNPMQTAVIMKGLGVSIIKPLNFRWNVNQFLALLEIRMELNVCLKKCIVARPDLDPQIICLVRAGPIYMLP